MEGRSEGRELRRTPESCRSCAMELARWRPRLWGLVVSLLLAGAHGWGPSPRVTSSIGRSMVMRAPLKPTTKKHSKVPVERAGKDLLSLKVNEKLTGTVIAEKETPRQLFLDVDVTREGRGDKHYPVFGMVRLLGPFANMTVEMGQRLDAYVDTVNAAAGRLTLKLTPVWRRPDVDETTGEALPVYKLDQLKVGMPLTGMVVSHSDGSAFLDCGVVVQRGSKLRRVNGRIFRLDLMERFALAPKFKGSRTEAVIKPGLIMQVYVRKVTETGYVLTVDKEITEEKAAAQQKEREEMRQARESRKDVSKLIIGTLRTGVITKILPDGGGVKVGIGAKKTAFVPVASLADAYGKEIKNLSKVVTVGGLLEVEIEEIDDDDRILLRCLTILKQPKPGSSNSKKPAAAAKKEKKKVVADDDDEWSYDDVY